MRNEGHIRRQLTQVIYRHRRRLARDSSRQMPHTCVHNRMAMVGLCFYDDPGVKEPRVLPRSLCDSRTKEGLEQARVCPWWKPHKTAEEVMAGFQMLLTGDRGRIAAEYPDIAALMWVLDDPESLHVDLLEILAEGPEEPEEKEPEEKEPKV